MYKIGIFSLELDLHAFAIMAHLRNKYKVQCHFVATNSMIEKGGLKWKSGKGNLNQLRSYEGEWFSIDELDLIWWRRVNQPQKETELIQDEISKQIVTNEWKSSLLGIVLDKFKGVWINKPHQDLYAGNKLYHLNAAESVGLRIPKTLISQDHETILNFCEELGGKVIVKKLLGTSLKPLVTLELTNKEIRNSKSAIQLCPAIYQEKIDGTKHVRANCFGEKVHAILIRANQLDWRRDLSIPLSVIELDSPIESKLISLLEMLDLKMGIMDLKFDNDGNLIWLELNTQGQFLFGEALTGYDLTDLFSQFLIECIERDRVITKLQ